MAVIDRPNISTSVAEELRAMIFRGEFEPGSPVNEVHLAARLSVSRTPIREALTTLVAEKAIDLLPRRGYFVRPLTETEAREIYAIRLLLEPEALRLAGLPSPEQLERLQDVNARFAGAPDAAAAIQIDDEWHGVLFGRCPNETLVEILWHIIRRTHRYELAVMGQPQVLRSSAGQHAQVTDALKRADLDAACDLLRLNLSGLDPVIRWLESRPAART